MLQLFHLDVVKLDLDVAFAIASHVYCKYMFQIFHLFQKYVASVLSGCCKSRSGCCIYCNSYVTSVCSKCFICFRHMLQVCHLGVAKVDLDVAYVAMAILQVYVLKCFIYFRHMF
jgi:hypothetical protein